MNLSASAWDVRITFSIGRPRREFFYVEFSYYTNDDYEKLRRLLTLSNISILVCEIPLAITFSVA